MQPTQRSLNECRKRGWMADVVERWIGPPEDSAGEVAAVVRRLRGCDPAQVPWVLDQIEREAKARRGQAFSRRRRKDAFGFGDVLVSDDSPGALLIQCTSAGGVAARVVRDPCLVDRS